jgi:hypothetical protein
LTKVVSVFAFFVRRTDYYALALHEAVSPQFKALWPAAGTENFNRYMRLASSGTYLGVTFAAA